MLTKIEEDLLELYGTPSPEYAHEFKMNQLLSSQFKESKGEDF